jgi:uracil phosphoribosyltransferase
VVLQNFYQKMNYRNMVHNLGEQNSLFNQFVSEIRDKKVQKDPLRFRRNLERMGEIMAYEISKELTYRKQMITTPLGDTEMQLLDEQPVLATILRAGLPVNQGLLNYFDRAPGAFVSAYRKYEKDGTFNIQIEYASVPEIQGRVLIISDPMLATGSSMVLAYQALAERGVPVHTHIVSLIASREGVEYVKGNIPTKNMSIWVGAIDEELTSKSYIVPGLGDAGDLAFGEKL